MRDRLFKQLVKTRKDLKQKYKTLKSDILKSQSQLEKTYHPITKPLKQLIATVEKSDRISPKVELLTPKIRKSLLPQPTQFTTPVTSRIPEKPIQPTEIIQNEDVYGDQTPIDTDYFDDSLKQFLEMTTSETFSQYLDQFHELPRQYVKENIQDTENQFDHRFGIYHNIATDKFKIGDSIVRFDGSDIIVKNVRYPGTVGLYELLFKNNPIGYSQKEADDYFDILKRSNALYRNFDSRQPLRGAIKEVQQKYKSVIQLRLGRKRSSSLPQVQTRQMMKKTTGGILMNFNTHPIEYKHFDDYNELVDRLKLLIASQSAGNNNHHNEIVSILEELREGKIIK